MEESLRLSRIEDKLDKLSDAIVALARMEERMETVFKWMNTHEDRQGVLEDKVDKITLKVSNNGQALRFAERVFWIAASAGVSTLFWYIR